MFNDLNIPLILTAEEYMELLNLYKRLRRLLYIAQTRRHNVLTIREFLESKFHDYLFKTAYRLISTTTSIYTKKDVERMLELLFKLYFYLNDNTSTVKESLNEHNEKYCLKYEMKYPDWNVPLSELVNSRKNKKLQPTLNDSMNESYTRFRAYCDYRLTPEDITRQAFFKRVETKTIISTLDSTSNSTPVISISELIRNLKNNQQDRNYEEQVMSYTSYVLVQNEFRQSNDFTEVRTWQNYFSGATQNDTLSENEPELAWPVEMQPDSNGYYPYSSDVVLDYNLFPNNDDCELENEFLDECP